MSDEDDFMPSCDEDDFDFGDEDDMMSQTSQGESHSENRYYTGKNYRADEPLRAEGEFQGVIDTDGQSEWAAKSAKQLFKMSINQGMSSDRTEGYFRQFLSTLLQADISQADREKSFNSMLDFILSTNPTNKLELHEIALNGLSQYPPDSRLVCRTQLNLARLLLDRKQYDSALKLVSHTMISPDVETAASWKLPLLIELYALHISLALVLGTGEEAEYYERASELKLHMTHPRISAVIRECGGLLAIRSEQWNEARDLMLVSFKSYDEAGRPERFRALRYYVLACIMTGSKLNPFDSQETKAYHEFEEVSELVSLVDAFFRFDPKSFKTTVKQFELGAKDDATMSWLIKKVQKSFDYQVLAHLLEPYSRVSYRYLADAAELSIDAIPELVTQLILDQVIPDARLDDVNGIVILSAQQFVVDIPQVSNLPLPSRYSDQNKAAARQREMESILTGRERVAQRHRDPYDVNDVLTQLVKATAQTQLAIGRPL